MNFCFDEIEFLIDVLDQYLTVLNQAMDLGLYATEGYEELGKELYEKSAKKYDRALDLYRKLSELIAHA